MFVCPQDTMLCSADEGSKGETTQFDVRAQDEAVQEDVASLLGSAEGSAFGSSFRGQPSQHDADSVASLLGPALGESSKIRCSCIRLNANTDYNI